MALEGQIDIGEIGGSADEQGNVKKYNQFHVVPVAEIPTVPPGGYYGALLKAATVSELQTRLAAALEVEASSIALAYDGKDLDLGLSFKENSVLEPGPTARREGVKVELVFALPAGVLPGAALREREGKKAAVAAAEAEILEKSRKEEATLMASRRQKDDEERKKREIQQQKTREAHDRKQRAEQLAVINHERIIFQVLEVGCSNGFVCMLPPKLQVGVFVRRLVLGLGLTETSAEGVCLIYADRPLLSEETMERVEPHSKVIYYFDSSPDKNRLGPELFLDLIRVEPFRGDEERVEHEERFQREWDAAREVPVADAYAPAPPPHAAADPE